MTQSDKYKMRGSNTTTFDDPEYGKHDPDASFRHSAVQYPAVLFELC
jgi:hypothetical protein